MQTDDRAQVEIFVARHWVHVLKFAMRVTLDEPSARSLLHETFLRALLGGTQPPVDESAQAMWLLKIAAHLAEERFEKPEVSFELLDETLRTEETRTDLVRSLSGTERNHLLWELKQGCMNSVVNCLPAGERTAFVLGMILGHTEAEGAAILGIKESAFRVRLSRARKKVADYLAPRCEHVNPANPCRCPSRLGVALGSGFLPSPGLVSLRPRPDFGRYGTPDGKDEPSRDVMAIYQSLPDPEIPPGLVDEILAAIAVGGGLPASGARGS